MEPKPLSCSLGRFLHGGKTEGIPGILLLTKIFALAEGGDISAELIKKIARGMERSTLNAPFPGGFFYPIRLNERNLICQLQVIFCDFCLQKQISIRRTTVFSKNFFCAGSVRPICLQSPPAEPSQSP